MLPTLLRSRWTVVCGLAGFFLLGGHRPAEACTCTSFMSFNDVARKAPLVVTARVASVGPGGSPTVFEPSDPRFIEIEVDRVTKGKLADKRVKVWNGTAGTSCGGYFRSMTVGTELRIALTPVVRKSAKEEAEMDLWWSVVGFKPPVGDYEITLGCAEPFILI